MQQPFTFKQAQILYFALLVGQVLIGIILFFQMQNGPYRAEVEKPFDLLIPALVILGIGISQFLQRKQLASAPVSAPLAEKLAHFRRWLVMKCGVAEAGNLLALALTFMFGNTTSFMWFGVGVALFFFLRPTPDGFAVDYQLSQEERDKLTA